MIPALLVKSAQVMLACLATLLIACDSKSPSVDPAGCLPAEERQDRTPSAEDLIELTNEHAAVYAGKELPGWRLRQIVIPWAGDSPSWFLYGPVSGKGAPMAAVFRDNLGQWQTAKDDLVEVTQELLILDPADLRLGPEAAVERFEANAPEVDIVAVTLLREEDCELRWLVSGFVHEEDGRPTEFVTSAITDSTGAYEDRERSDVPDLP